MSVEMLRAAVVDTGMPVSTLLWRTLLLSMIRTTMRTMTRRVQCKGEGEGVAQSKI